MKREPLRSLRARVARWPIEFWDWIGEGYIHKGFETYLGLRSNLGISTSNGLVSVAPTGRSIPTATSQKCNLPSTTIPSHDNFVVVAAGKADMTGRLENAGCSTTGFAMPVSVPV